MRRNFGAVVALALVACGGSEPSTGNEPSGAGGTGGGFGDAFGNRFGGAAGAAGTGGSDVGGSAGATSSAGTGGTGGTAPAAGSGGATTAGTGGAASVCVPGAQVACACPGGVMGAQACNANGTGYGACACGTGGDGGSGTAGGSGGAATTPNGCSRYPAGDPVCASTSDVGWLCPASEGSLDAKCSAPDGYPFGMWHVECCPGTPSGFAGSTGSAGAGAGAAGGSSPAPSYPCSDGTCSAPGQCCKGIGKPCGTAAMGTCM